MTGQKYVDANDPFFRLREIFSIFTFAIPIVIVSIIFSIIISYLPPWNGFRILLVLFAAPVMMIWYMNYFMYKHHGSIILDPWVPKKLKFILIIPIAILMFYRPDQISVQLTYILIAANIVLCYFFKEYLFGVCKEGQSLERMVRIKSLWLCYPTGFTVISISLLYLSYTLYPTYRAIFLIVCVLCLSFSVLTVWFYIFSSKRSKSVIFKDGAISSKIEWIYQSAVKYPINTQVGLAEYIRGSLRNSGEIIANRLLELLREDHERNEEFEEKYTTYMGYVFGFYVISVYISPAIWWLMDFLPTEYVIVPQFDMGFYGLILVFYGSLCLAADPLTDLPYVNNITQPLIVAISQLGFLFLATGTFLQISTYIDPNIFMEEYTYSTLVQLEIVSLETINLIMVVSHAMAAFFATPTLLILLYLTYIRVDSDLNNQG